MAAAGGRARAFADRAPGALQCIAACALRRGHSAEKSRAGGMARHLLTRLAIMNLLKTLTLLSLASTLLLACSAGAEPEPTNDPTPEETQEQPLLNTGGYRNTVDCNDDTKYKTCVECGALKDGIFCCYPWEPCTVWGKEHKVFTRR